MRSMGSNTKENIPDEPDLSIEKAKGDFALFVPGISAGLLLYVVFGTTQHFRQYTAKLLLPRRVREWLARSKEEQPGPYTGPPPVPPKEYPYRGDQYELPTRKFSQRNNNHPHQSSDDGFDDDLEKQQPQDHQKQQHQQHQRSKSYQEHRVQIRQHPRNSPSQPRIEEDELSPSSRPSLSWYGSRPSDVERAYSEFSPIDNDNSHHHHHHHHHHSHGTIPLQYIEPKRPQRVSVSGNVGSNTNIRPMPSAKNFDDEWPILAQAVSTPLAPRPRSRSGDRQ